MDGRLERRKLRRQMGSYGWALLIYYILMNVCVSVVMEMDVLAAGFQAVIRSGSWDAFLSGMQHADYDAISSNAWGYILACLLGLGLVLLWKGGAFMKGIWKTDRHMTPKAFAQLLCVFISGQMAFSICASFQEWVLSWFGLSALEAIELASGGADTLSMFLYMGLFAPIAEEILFRGVVMRGLRPFGKRFAVVASALLFGLFHGNIVQSPYAFAVGLVLGYTAMEYNILWAMVLHMVNNLVLGDLILRIAGEMGAAVSSWLVLVCTAAAIGILISRRKEIWAYHRADQPEYRYVGAFASSPGILALFVVMQISAFGMLFL